MTIGQERFSGINQVLCQLLERNKSLIAVHRGSWGGNICQNTVAAYMAAEAMGADMVEADINSSTDGILYSIHDGYEKEIWGVSKSVKQMDSVEIEGYHPINTVRNPCSRRISRLSQILEYLPEHMLLNIDRAWDIFPKLVTVLDAYPEAVKQVIIKAPLREKEAIGFLNDHPVKYMFMPICYSMADVEEALSWPELNVVGCELTAFSDEDELFQDDVIQRIHDKGLFTWANAIQLGDWNRKPLFGSLDDDISILKDPALGWGRLFEKKIDIIQTDWPAILHRYRAQYFGL